MSVVFNLDTKKDARILLLSLRKMKFHVARCYLYELEDLICEFDSADILTPVFNPELFKVTNRIANTAAQAVGSSKIINPLFKHFNLDKEYELFFVICQSPLDILTINSIKNWRNKCRKVVVWLDEIWAKDIEKWKVQLSVLQEFDYIFMNFSQSIEGVTKTIQHPCEYIPFGIDAIKFCPYPLNRERSVDLYSVGRRSQVTHQALLDLSERVNFFYIYETIKDLYTIDHRYHRSLYKNILKKSRYFIANRAKIDDTNATGDQQEVGARFFEGAAAGTVMLGVPPECESFTQNFDWEDAVIKVSYDAPNIAKILAELDSQPDRLQKIRTDNVINSLLKHDWVYRWETILATVGLNSTPAMMARKAHLQNLVERILTRKNSEERSAHYSDWIHKQGRTQMPVA
ncbi:hypothetical protein B7486_38500 [cyanobacterium TDX16]|nr:hypothetical protein B7486_38500 [cyanobacterium TDX16]